MDLDVENWQVLADRHRQCDDDPRRCRDCQGYWPCTYRLRAEHELSSGFASAAGFSGDLGLTVSLDGAERGSTRPIMIGR